MQIGEEQQGCLYWGYQVASEANNMSKTREERRAALMLYKEQTGVIRKAGYASYAHGLTKGKAIDKAKALEARFPDIEMKVFNHGYL